VSHSKDNADAVANDHTLRSQLVHGLVQDAQSLPLDSINQDIGYIPKVLIQYWHDLSELPADVSTCMSSWDPVIKREQIERLVFEDKSANEFLIENFDEEHERAFSNCHHPAMRCDYFRLCYLSKRGGFYVDADEEFRGGGVDQLFEGSRLKLQPLCFDLRLGAMVPFQDFGRDVEFNENRIYYVNNNPLVAPKDHSLVNRSLEQATYNLLHTPKPHDVQATTGPGNFTYSLVKTVVEEDLGYADCSFRFVFEWDKISISKWPLSYRNDKRNWRLWNPPK